MPEGKNALLYREASGLAVELSYLPGVELLALNVAFGDERMATVVEPDHALDAFHHPTLYLAPAQVEKLGIR